MTAAEPSPVSVEVRDGTQWITLRRPAVLNAMNSRMEDAVLAALEAAAMDAGVRAVALRGAGPCFSAGHDVRSMGRREREGSLPAAILRLEKPVVASLHGYVLGAALSLAVACDLRIAARTARLGMPFVQRGVVGGTYLLPRLIGIGRATPMLFLGEPIGGEEAERIGLVHRAVDDAQLEAVTAELVARLASLPTRAIGIMKRAMHESLSAGIEAGLASERGALTAARATEDYREGVQAARERRPPRFVGR